MSSAENIIPIILAGGAGRRLWPLTGRHKPKPFVKMGGHYNLLQETLIRCASMAPPVIVCHRFFLDKVQHSLQELAPFDLPIRAIVAEPMARSTAPAIASAAMTMAPYMTFVVMPSDHVIGDEGALARTIEQAAKHVARYGGIVSIGIKPRHGSRRFGYMHSGAAFDKKTDVRQSDYFIEKPSVQALKIAKAKGGMLWNTGIFVARVYDYLQEFERVEPEYMRQVKDAFEDSTHYENIYEPRREKYITLPEIPVDNAVLEHALQRGVIEYKGYWNDVGTLPSFFKTLLLRFFGIIRV